MNEIMYYGGIIGIILFGGGSIILFGVLRIYAVIGELTGITAKRSIRRIQREGYGEKNKAHSIRDNTDEIVARRGRTTGKLKPGIGKSAGRLYKQSEEEEQTTVLNLEREEATIVLQQPHFRFEMKEDIVVTHSEEVIVDAMGK